MKAIAYSTLRRHPLDFWPGTETLVESPGGDRFAAIEIVPDDATVPDVIQTYSAFSGCSGSPDNADLLELELASLLEGEYPRFLAMRLLMREWSRRLHDNRLNIILSDYPGLKSRVRSYKGLFKPECRGSALVFEQHEVETGPESCVLVNRIELDSVASARCFDPLCLVSSSFGIYDWPGPPAGASLLARLASCGVEKGRVWNWDTCRLLKFVCAESLPLFLQHGNWDNAKVFVYVPSKDLMAHVLIAESLFGAEVSEAC
jgi:hypothetical protein